MKAVLASDFLNTYPDYEKELFVYADASNYQVGEAIIQDRRLIEC